MFWHIPNLSSSFAVLTIYQIWHDLTVCLLKCPFLAKLLILRTENVPYLPTGSASSYSSSCQKRWFMAVSAKWQMKCRGWTGFSYYLLLQIEKLRNTKCSSRWQVKKKKVFLRQSSFVQNIMKTKKFAWSRGINLWKRKLKRMAENTDITCGSERRQAANCWRLEQCFGKWLLHASSVSCGCTSGHFLRKDTEPDKPLIWPTHLAWSAFSANNAKEQN